MRCTVEVSPDTVVNPRPHLINTSLGRAMLVFLLILYLAFVATVFAVDITYMHEVTCLSPILHSHIETCLLMVAHARALQWSQYRNSIPVDLLPCPNGSTLSGA